MSANDPGRTHLVFGTPSVLEHDGPWKRTPDDPDVTEEEYDQVYDAFEDFLNCRFGATDGGREKPCYFRGDNTHDRTQQLEFRTFDALTPEFVRELQGLLRRAPYRLWRIFVWAGAPEDMLVIYPDVICAARALSDSEQDDEIRAIARRQIERDRRREEERQARIDRMRTFLAGAYDKAARSGRIAYLVHSERGTGKDDGRVWMWLGHPHDQKWLKLGYQTRPKALRWETFYLLPDDRLLDKMARPPSNAMLLIMWGFEEDESRKLVLEKGSERVEFPCPE
jgi:hypothetical protein